MVHHRRLPVRIIIEPYTDMQNNDVEALGCSFLMVSMLLLKIVHRLNRKCIGNEFTATVL